MQSSLSLKVLLADNNLMRHRLVAWDKPSHRIFFRSLCASHSWYSHDNVSGVGNFAQVCMRSRLRSCGCCVQGRTDSGHLYVMDPTDILSTGARGMGSSPLGFELTETGQQDAAGVARLLVRTPTLHWLSP